MNKITRNYVAFEILSNFCEKYLARSHLWQKQLYFEVILGCSPVPQKIGRGRCFKGFLRRILRLVFEKPARDVPNHWSFHCKPLFQVEEISLEVETLTDRSTVTGMVDAVIVQGGRNISYSYM